jgi:hypothetical protein
VIQGLGGLDLEGLAQNIKSKGRAWMTQK